MAGVRRNFDESRVTQSLHKFKLFYSPLCFTKARYCYSYIDGFRWFFRVKCTVRSLFKVQNLTDPYYLTISMVKRYACIASK